MKTNAKKLVPALIVLVVLIAVFWGVYRQFSPKAQSGEKQITISIVDDTGTQSDYALNTDAEYLLEALQSVAEIDGEESPEYGYTLYTVNGLTADFTTGNAYWAIYVNGEYGSYGLSQQPVTDGDTYAIVSSVSGSVSVVSAWVVVSSVVCTMEARLSYLSSVFFPSRYSFSIPTQLIMMIITSTPTMIRWVQLFPRFFFFSSIITPHTAVYQP